MSQSNIIETGNDNVGVPGSLNRICSTQCYLVITNPRFHQYATAAGFRIHACEGYDPEGKGKVEAGVKYVRQGCFYGEAVEHPDTVQEQVRTWLEEVANVRLHGITGVM